MARHRKISARRQKNAHGLAVMAFLGLAVVSAPVAGATADEGSTGASTGTDSGTGAGGSGSSGQASGGSGSSGDAKSGGDTKDDGTKSDGTTSDGTTSDGTTSDGTKGDSEDASTTPEPSKDPASTPTSGATTSDPEPSETADPEPSSTVETSTAPKPDATEPTDTSAAGTTEPEPAKSADGTVVTKTQEIAPTTEAVAKTMSLAAVSDTSSSSSLVIDPYGLPDNPFNTTDPTRQSLNPIGQFIEAITPAYPKIAGTSDVAFAVTVVKFLNTVLGWTQSNGQDTIFSWGAYVLFAAAYQRLIDIGSNTLASVKVTGTSQVLGVVTVGLEVKNPDDTVYLPQLAGITENGNAWVYEPVSQTIVLTVTNPSMLLSGGDDTVQFTVDDSLGYLNHPIGAQSVTVDIPVHINPVISVNGLPYFEIGAAKVTSTDTSGVVHGTVVAKDPDGDSITYTGSTLAGTGTVAVDSDGNWTYTPSATAQHAAGTLLGLKNDLVYITATDSKGGSSILPASVTVDITPKNTDPTVSLGTGPTLNILRTSYTGTLNSGDADGDSLYFSASALPVLGATAKGGLVTVNPLNGDYTYTPAGTAWFNGGSDSFDITVDDLHGGTATVTVVINGANSAPTFTTPATATITNSSTGTAKITAVAVDPEGGPVTYTAQADNARGTVTLNADGSWTFVASDAARHAAADTGLISGLFAPKTETITVTATDETGASKSSSVTVDLVALNTNPTLTLGDGPALNALRTSYTGTVNGADADSDSLSYGGSTITSKGGTVLVLGNTYTYTPFGSAWFNGGSDSFDVSVDDGHGGTATVTVVINGANKAPTVAASATVTDSSTGTAKITAVASDPEGGPVTLSASVDSSLGTLSDNGDGSWTFVASDAARHAAADTGLISGLFTPKSATITITATDDKGASKAVTVSVDLVGKNTNPTLTLGDGPALNALRTSYTGTVNGADADGDSLSYGGSTITSSGGTVLVLGNTYTYTPLGSAWFNGGSDSFDVSVDDGHGGTATVTVVINGANKAPTVAASASTPDSSTGKSTITVVTADPEGGPVTVTAAVDASLGSVTSNGDGTWTFTPTDAARHAAADTGLISGLLTPNSATVTLTATDDKGASKSVTVSINLVTKNVVPTITLTSSPKLNALGTSYVGTVTVHDDDGDSMSVTAPLFGNSGGTVLVTPNGGGVYTYSLTPLGTAWLNGGSDSFDITVNDGHGGTAKLTVNVGVAKNQAPTVSASAATPNSSTGKSIITVTASDPEGSPVTVTASVDASLGSVVNNGDGTWTFTPTDAARHGAADTGLISGLLSPDSATVTFTATDDKNAASTAKVTITLVPANKAPVATATTPSLFLATYVGTVNATDPDGDSMSYSASTPANKNGTVVMVGNAYTYTPNLLTWFTGATDSFVVTVDDGHGGKTTVTVPITIAVNHDPSISSVSATTPDSSTGSSKITVVATDSDGDTLTYTAKADNGRGTVTSNGDGTWTFKPTDDARHIAATTGAAGLLAAKTETVTITADDGKGGTSSKSVTIDIVPANTAPGTAFTTTITSTSPGSTETIKGKVVGTDAEDDSLSYASGIFGYDTRSTAKGGSVTIYSDGTFTYTSDSGDTHAAALPTATAADKQDSFVVTITDGHGGSRDVTVNVNLDAYNRAPSVSSSTSSTRDVDNGIFGHSYSNSTTFHVTVSDADSDPFTYTGVSTTSKGTVTVVANTTFGDSLLGLKGWDVTYKSNTTSKPNPSETFTVYFADDHGGTSTLQLTY